MGTFNWSKDLGVSLLEILIKSNALGVPTVSKFCNSITLLLFIKFSFGDSSISYFYSIFSGSLSDETSIFSASSTFFY